MWDLTGADGIREKKYLRSYGQRTREEDSIWLEAPVVMERHFDPIYVGTWIISLFLATKYVLKQLEPKKNQKTKKQNTPKNKIKNNKKQNQTHIHNYNNQMYTEFKKGVIYIYSMYR